MWHDELVKFGTEMNARDSAENGDWFWVAFLVRLVYDNKIKKKNAISLTLPVN